jgi:hypothetical protein
VVAFFSPLEFDMRVIKGVLSLFEKSSGLAANYSKSYIYPIADNLGGGQDLSVCRLPSSSMSAWHATFETVVIYVFNLLYVPFFLAGLSLSLSVLTQTQPLFFLLLMKNVI